LEDLLRHRLRVGSDQEISKIRKDIRLLRNRLAAKKSREDSRDRWDQLQRRNDALERENRQLKELLLQYGVPMQTIAQATTSSSDSGFGDSSTDASGYTSADSPAPQVDLSRPAVPGFQQLNMAHLIILHTVLTVSMTFPSTLLTMAFGQQFPMKPLCPIMRPRGLASSRCISPMILPLCSVK
jgi:hypothetical protein